MGCWGTFASVRMAQEYVNSVAFVPIP